MSPLLPDGMGCAIRVWVHTDWQHTTTIPFVIYYLPTILVYVTRTVKKNMNLLVHGSAAAGNRLILPLLESLQELCIGPRPYSDVLCASDCQDCVIKICIVRVLFAYCMLNMVLGHTQGDIKPDFTSYSSSTASHSSLLTTYYTGSISGQIINHKQQPSSFSSSAILLMKSLISCKLLLSK